MADQMSDTPKTDELAAIAGQVEQRADELTAGLQPQPEIDDQFVAQCLANNERGDGCLFASMHRGHYILNVTPKNGGEWYAWDRHVWTLDLKRRAVNAVEDCALEYQARAERLTKEILDKGIQGKKHPESWKIGLRDKYRKRAERLRGRRGAESALYWAPVVEPSMACREEDFDNKPWLLPVQNGVIDLQTGALTKGRPEDLLTRRLDIDYNPHADYTIWQEFIDEVSGSPEMAAFLQRSFGYAITGHSFEQYIWVFVGPGRNGKGTLFDLLGDVMGPYYHEIKKGMILEQRNEPSPAAASEHLYSLLRKRIIVGAETNRGERIDPSAIKRLTGEDRVVCRPNFGSEINFYPTHTLFLHVNHLPVGLAREFSMIQRLLLIEFPYMYVEDVEAEKRKHPIWADRFRKKDPKLKDRLREHREGILRWLVEGCLAWQEQGLATPPEVLDRVDRLAQEEDYLSQFLRDCLVACPDQPETRISTSRVHEYFRWWWAQNKDARADRCPSQTAINSSMRERGFRIERKGGRYWLYQFTGNEVIADEVDEFIHARGGKS